MSEQVCFSNINLEINSIFEKNIDDQCNQKIAIDYNDYLNYGLKETGGVCPTCGGPPLFSK